MHYEQVRRTVPTQKTPQEIKDGLRSSMPNVRIDDLSGKQLTGRSGSKLLYRLFGAYVWPGSVNFPMRFTVSADESDGARKVVTVDSDMGPYVVSVPRSEKLYRESADKLIAAVSR
jgi:hypothetical protein